MNENPLKIEDVRSLLKKIGVTSEEYEHCTGWTSPELNERLGGEDRIVAELTKEEEGLLRCMGYAQDVKVIDRLRLTALYEIFWGAVIDQHDLSSGDLAVKESKYVVTDGENRSN